MMKKLLTLFTLLLVTTFATSAFAGDTEVKAIFSVLDGQFERNELQVSYEITPKSWREIQKAGIRPQLVLYEATRDGRQDFRFSVELTKRRANIGFPKNLRLQRNDRLLVAIEGHHGYFHVDTTTFGEDCGRMIPLDLGRRAHQGSDHHPDRGDHHPDHAHPGHDNPGGKHDRDGFAAKIIKACGTAMAHKSSECIKLAADLEPAFAAATITACGEETEWDTEVQQCLRSAATYKNQNPAPVVTACGNATKWSSELMTCMTAASTHAKPADAVEACDAHTEWNSDLKKCLNASEPLGRRASSIIRACGDTTQWSSELTSCIRKAGTLKRHG